MPDSRVLRRAMPRRRRVAAGVHTAIRRGTADMPRDASAQDTSCAPPGRVLRRAARRKAAITANTPWTIVRAARVSTEETRARADQSDAPAKQLRGMRDPIQIGSRRSNLEA